mmetsp:Transcript_26453/g.66596  ORF Transcript_26453/g.66596 Transcript_26453/m.66596 type:complete len:281 (+) Transcript_26453:277-1119(+)
MPTPTCASWIIGTSFAPSPTDSVTGVGLTPSRTSRTICAFCSGDTRHAMTTEHAFARSRKRPLSATSPKMSSRAAPVTMTALFSVSRPESLEASSLTRLDIACDVPASSLSKVAMVMLEVSTRALKPMFRAVSSLSPVRTQRLIPASRSRSIVSGTCACNLSSMAVTPTISMSTSSSSATFASSPSRSVMACWASWYFFSHASHSPFVSARRLTTSVLRPSPAKVPRADSSSFSVFLLSLEDLSIMTLSAPFANKKYSWSLCTTTDIRLRAESKALTARI